MDQFTYINIQFWCNHESDLQEITNYNVLSEIKMASLIYRHKDKVFSTLWINQQDKIKIRSYVSNC